MLVMIRYLRMVASRYRDLVQSRAADVLMICDIQVTLEQVSCAIIH
jgi:hypothetical protein